MAQPLYVGVLSAGRVNLCDSSLYGEGFATFEDRKDEKKRDLGDILISGRKGGQFCDSCYAHSAIAEMQCLLQKELVLIMSPYLLILWSIHLKCRFVAHSTHSNCRMRPHSIQGLYGCDLRCIMSVSCLTAFTMLLANVTDRCYCPHEDGVVLVGFFPLQTVKNAHFIQDSLLTLNATR